MTSSLESCQIRDVEVDQDAGYEIGKHKFVFVLEGEELVGPEWCDASSDR